MLVFVVICNLFITLINSFIAWKIWQMRQALASIADILIALDGISAQILYIAPYALAPGQIATRNLKKRYRQLNLQLRQIRIIITIVSLVYKIYQGQYRQSRYIQQIRKLTKEQPINAWLEYDEQLISQKARVN